MPRSPLVVALAAGLIVVLSTINLLHRFGPSGWDSALWSWHQTSLKERDVTANGSQQYLLGVGKADITGPVVEINFMGYANASQLGSGLRQRLYSRSFIIGDVENPKDRFIYMVLDTQSGDTAVRHGILEGLADLGDEYAVYGQQNVAVTGTHAHSGPGAWLNYLLPQITSKGFNKPSYQAIVDGAVKSIKIAHENLAPGHLSVGTTDIEDASISRSAYAYIQNPLEERQRYDHNVDKAMTLLRFTHTTDSGDEKEIGVLNWFAVHGTSMLGNNSIVTGDNKGVAAWMFESSMNDDSFVAGFSQANVGDTTPNVLGAYCEYGKQAGQPCDFKTSLCDGTSQACHGRGPYFGLNDYGTASTYEIGTRQYQGAKSLFDNASAFTPVTGDVVRSLHQFVDLSTFHFALSNGTMVKTCPGALGYSFAAGTSDGPGAFDFKQADPGDPNASPLWAVVSDLLHKPNETQEACQGEKPILLDVGETDTPYAWSPNIVDVQLFRVGQFFIIVSPGEATTMSGRRWREAVQQSAAGTFSDLNDTDPVVVLGAPANSYTHYIATPEEYSVQRYEGASTLFGPWTLDAYLNLSVTLLPYLSPSLSASLPSLDPGPSPPINTNKSLSFITGVVVDNAPIFKSFGDQLTAPKATYTAGDSILAKFVGANPRNNFRLDGTFAAVERFDSATSVWTQVRDDSDWSLLYEWKRTSTVLGTSEVSVTWETKWETGSWRPSGGVSGEVKEPHGELLASRQSGGLAGLYRIKYYGDSKALDGSIKAFEGTSSEFRVG
jgi:neutral ceramidase